MRENNLQNFPNQDFPTLQCRQSTGRKKEEGRVHNLKRQELSAKIIVMELWHDLIRRTKQHSENLENEVYFTAVGSEETLFQQLSNSQRHSNPSSTLLLPQEAVSEGQAVGSTMQLAANHKDLSYRAVSRAVRNLNHNNKERELAELWKGGQIEKKKEDIFCHRRHILPNVGLLVNLSAYLPHYHSNIKVK